MKNIHFKRMVSNKYIIYILLIGVFILLIPEMLKGIDLTDMAYMLARYKYVFDQEIPINDFSIIVTDILGGILYQAVPEGQVFLISIACWALNCGIALLSLQLLRKYLNGILLSIILIGGSLFSITFIHVLHYNTFSMFFQVLGFSLLMKGLDRKSKRLILMSGFIQGFNILVRLPNILQLSFGILIVWYFGDDIKNHRKIILNYIRQYVIGVCSGGLFGVCLGGIVLVDTTIKSLVSDTIKSLGDNSSSHGAAAIIRRFFEGIYSGIKNTARYEMFIFFGIIALFILLDIFIVKGKYISEQKRIRCYRIAENLSFIFMILWGLLLAKKLSYISILEIMFTNEIVICIFSSVYLRKKENMLSTICVGCVLMELILTIGTNNGTSFYVVFMGFPMAVTVCALWKDLSYRYGRVKNSCKNVITVALIGLLSIAGYQYYDTYVYRDTSKKLLDYEVNIKEYKGIKTSIERAEYLEKLVGILKPYDEYQLIAMGDFAIGYVITDMVPFFSSSWPDLTSFSIERFRKEIEKKQEQQIYPVIVLADVYQTGKYRSQEKIEMVMEFISKSEKYKIKYQDEYYRIYVPIENKKDN